MRQGDLHAHPDYRTCHGNTASLQTLCQLLWMPTDRHLAIDVFLAIDLDLAIDQPLPAK